MRVVRNIFSPPMKVAITFPKQGRTKQSFKPECDINSILAKYNKTGQLPGLIKENPQYGDFSDARTYQESLNLVLLAQEQFEALPALVRKRFNNEPESFLAFAEDPTNGEELVKMGLATIREPASSGEPSGASNKTPSPAVPDPAPEATPKKK